MYTFRTASFLVLTPEGLASKLCVLLCTLGLLGLLGMLVALVALAALAALGRRECCRCVG